MTLNVDAPAFIVTTEFENVRKLRFVEILTVTASLALFVKNAVSGNPGKPPVPPAQVAVTFETAPAEQETLVNPMGSMPVKTFVCQAVGLVQTSLPFVQVMLIARARDTLASNPTAMTVAMRAEVDFRNIRVTGCD